MKQKTKRGFTVLELTLVLALIGLLMGLVVVRFNFGSPRQNLIAQARKLGNVITAYRERAISEEQVYAMQFDLSANTWAMRRLDEKGDVSPERLKKPVTSGSFDPPVMLKTITVAGSKDVDSPSIIYFDARGIVPELQLKLCMQGGAGVTLRLDPLVNEVTYVEQ
jgi:prepilin-type N-terminal cleavage/methylation domain-containing protein